MNAGKPGIMSARRRGGVIAGMAPPAAATSGDGSDRAGPTPPQGASPSGEPVAKTADGTPAKASEAAAGHTDSATPSAQPAGASATAPPRAGRPPRKRAEIGGLSFAGARKTSVTTRGYQPLWQAYGDLAHELTRAGGGRVFQADVVNAVLATCLPKSNDEALERLAQYKAILEADPPADMRRAI